MAKMIPLFKNSPTFRWNYLGADHDRGRAVKRTYDRYLKHGSFFQDFPLLKENSPKIRIVNTAAITAQTTEFAETSSETPRVKGT